MGVSRGGTGEGVGGEGDTFRGLKNEKRVPKSELRTPGKKVVGCTAFDPKKAVRSGSRASLPGVGDIANNVLVHDEIVHLLRVFAEDCEDLRRLGFGGGPLNFDFEQGGVI